MVDSERQRRLVLQRAAMNPPAPRVYEEWSGGIFRVAPR